MRSVILEGAGRTFWKIENTASNFEIMEVTSACWTARPVLSTVINVRPRHVYNQCVFVCLCVYVFVCLLPSSVPETIETEVRLDVCFIVSDS